MRARKAKKRQTKKSFKPYANTDVIRNLPEYKSAKKKYHLIIASVIITIIISIISVTIVSPDTEMADALSTGLYVAGLEEAVSIWKETPGFEAVFITDDGTVYVTEGLASCFTINKDYSPKLVIIEK